jgi:two-component system OmpR family response regulator
LVPGAPRILVADDDPALRNLIADVIRDEFDTIVDTVADGDAAMAALSARSYAVAVIDMLMPGADGFAVLRWLGTRPADARVPVVLCTASGETHNAEAARLGAAACVAKPFDLVELLAALRPFLTAPPAELVS